MPRKFKSYMGCIAALFVLLLSSAAFAAPACPIPVEFTQPNGDIIAVTTYGDEFFSWSEDENGNIIIYKAIILIFTDKQNAIKKVGDTNEEKSV